jgi:peptidoglycan/LPS O-acetylase OafA/YrhL
MMKSIVWPALWLVCGMLAAREIGMRGTASRSDSALAVFYAVAALLGLWMMVRRSVRAGRPARLLLPLALSLAGPALIALLIRQRKPAPGWIDTLFAASGLLAFSACVILIGTVVAWRRREANRERRHKDMQASARQRLSERRSSGPLQELAAELEFPPAAEDADLLPARKLKR